MISLKAVLWFLLISVYARNIVIIGVINNDPQGSSHTENFIHSPEDNSDNNAIEMLGGEMILSNTPEEPLKSIYDYILICRNDKKILRNFVEKYDLVLYVFIDPKYHEFDEQIEYLNQLNEYYADHVFIYGILTENDPKVYDSAVFTICDPVDGLWEDLLFNALDLFTEPEKYKEIKKPFTKFLVVNQIIISIVHPSDYKGLTKNMNCILSKLEKRPIKPMPNLPNEESNYLGKMEDRGNYVEDDSWDTNINHNFYDWVGGW